MPTSKTKIRKSLKNNKEIQKEILFPEELVLSRSVLVEKLCPEFVILEKSLSNIPKLKVEYYIHKGKDIIICFESPWLGNKLFGSRGQVTCVMCVIIDKKFLKNIISILNNDRNDTNFNLRSFLLFEYNKPIKLEVNCVIYTGFYAIPKKGKSIFVNTLLKIFKDAVNDVNNIYSDIYLTEEKNKKIGFQFSQCLPMLLMEKDFVGMAVQDINDGNFITKLPIPGFGKISLLKQKISLWEKGLFWDGNGFATNCYKNLTKETKIE